jgi:nitrite reductase/ring-hydroxylating ferredoxin subunit
MTSCRHCEAEGKAVDSWHEAVQLADLEREGRLVARVGGRQIALFATPQGVFACNNRCPHEGYPLSEGLLDGACVLTCQWHNWKFDLRTGENRLGGDRLRVYPVSIRDGRVWVDLSEAPFELRRAETLSHLREAFDDEDHQRLARELARLHQLGADPIDVVVDAIVWSHDRLEFGWTHAYAGAADWLRLHDEHSGDAETQLICLLESVAHMAHDALREPVFAYTLEAIPYDETHFVQAVEEEEEASAVAMIRGALRAGCAFGDVERGLTRAALAHYNDFGHSLIYLTKAAQLIRRLGPRVVEALLVSLVRSLVYATREDQIPEFRGYRAALQRWGTGSGAIPEADAWRGLGIDAALERTLTCSAVEPERLYAVLLGASADAMVHFDARWQERTRIPVSDNVGWLDFTHAITFGSAVRMQCSRFPELWPQGLLQMACFSGRNARYTDPRIEERRWLVDDVELFLNERVQALFDHGCPEFIVSVHLLKTVLAVREELGAGLPHEVAATLAAALNRFISTPLKRRHVRRTAYQAIRFVAREG